LSTKYQCLDNVIIQLFGFTHDLSISHRYKDKWYRF
jgi:hypothetical protein